MGDLSRMDALAQRMHPGVAWIALTLLACLLAAIFGACHNQLSYTLSAEYFHAYKFHQFQLTESLRSRAGASLVGVLASWWMGLPIGGLLGGVGLFFRDRAHFWRETLTAFKWVVIATLLCAALGLGAGVAINLFSGSPRFNTGWHGQPLVAPTAFFLAGMMHNGSYAGGVLGLVAALFRQTYRVGYLRGQSTSRPE